MKFELKHILGIFSRSILAIALFAYLLIPSQFSFAFQPHNDCGPHYIELCQEHNNSHFVMSHHNDLDGATTFSSESTNSSSHDSSHQIELDSSSYVIVTQNTIEDLTQFTALVSSRPFALQFADIYNFQYPSSDPPGNNNQITFIKTVRLQI